MIDVLKQFAESVRQIYEGPLPYCCVEEFVAKFGREFQQQELPEAYEAEIEEFNESGENNYYYLSLRWR